MANSKLRADIMLMFKLNGFTLRSDSTKYLIDILTPLYDDEERRVYLDKIIGALHGQPLESSCISKETIEMAVKECGEHRRDEDSQIFILLNAFHTPKLHYDETKKKLVECSNLGSLEVELFGTPEDKANIFLERYHLIHQRILRHELFSQSQQHDSSQQKEIKKYQLLTVEDLLASSCAIESVVTFGMLSQLKEDKFYLEDPTGVVQLDLSDTVFQSGLYTENCLCLVEGSYEENTLTATAIGLPPIEPSSSTLAHHITSIASQSTSFSSVQRKFSPNLASLEQEKSDATMIFLSDVWLDSAVVLQKLQTLMDGLTDTPPVAIVFAGDYLSKAYGAEESKILKAGFKNLAELIQRYLSISGQSHFVFVPSVRDPWLTSILPKPALPTGIVQPFTSKIANCHYATNPCRLRYCTQDIVVFREDIIEKMCRNCIRAPVTDENGIGLEQQFAKTILTQSHLAPLPLHVSPIYWPYDYALRLYPIPDVIVCCDKYKPYTELVGGCVVTNPGSFARNGSFQVYIPASRQVEDSEI